VTDHVRPDLNRIVDLSGVDRNNATHKLWHNNSVTEMGLDGLWLLSNLAVLLRYKYLVEEADVLWLKTTVHATTLATVHELVELFVGHLNEIV
jgi:hypothetical protein